MDVLTEYSLVSGLGALAAVAIAIIVWVIFR